MRTYATPGIRQDLDPTEWRTHLFGLAPARWARLSGLRLAISGAGSGFGRCFSAALALAGARPILIGRRPDALAGTRDAAAKLGADPAAMAIRPADLRDGAAVAASLADFDTVDGAIANAAVPQNFGGGAPLADAEEADWTRLLDVNVTGQWRLLRAAWRRSAGSFRAFAVTSEAGWADTPGMGPYNVSKAALNTLAASFAAECARAAPAADVQINALIPGEARTEMNRGSPDSPWMAVPMALALLSHPPGGPNGRFFHRDGRHFAFAYAVPWPRRLDRPEDGA
jgi:NAD(P)-dependent dehydrogenase (short-subunit alcohol dehydrogenase family)